MRDIRPRASTRALFLAGTSLNGDLFPSWPDIIRDTLIIMRRKKKKKDFPSPICLSALRNGDLWQSANLSAYLCTPRAVNYTSYHFVHECRARLHNDVYVVRTVSSKTTVILPRVSRADEERYSEWTAVKYNCNLSVADVHTRWSVAPRGRSR